MMIMKRNNRWGRIGNSVGTSHFQTQFHLRSRSFQFKTFSSSPEKPHPHPLVVGCYSNGELTPGASQIDTLSNGELTQLLQSSNFKGKFGNLKVFYGRSNSPFNEVAVVGLGDISTSGKLDFNKKVVNGEYKNERDAVRVATALGVKAIQKEESFKVYLDSFGDNEASAEGAHLALYSYKKKTPYEIIPLFGDEDWKKGQTLSEAQNVARDLCNAPANLMTPSIFASQVVSLFNGIEGVQVNVRDIGWMKEQGMGGVLGVSQGSAEPPAFLEIIYQPLKDSPPLVYVGKGVTFDSGGISIKPSENMHAMKGDMGGAASVVASIYGIAKLKSLVNVVGVIPLCENLPSGTAIKPGDVLKSRNGTTIEVLNTDAEGRLILADALSYAEDTFRPHTMVDIATLTGAISMALGSEAIGAFTNDDQLWNEIEYASNYSGDICWRMPLFSAYKKGLEKSDVADLKNIGGRPGASIAAVFLQHFTKLPRWVHLDIAGVDFFTSSERKGYITEGMSGSPTRALIKLAQVFKQQK